MEFIWRKMQQIMKFNSTVKISRYFRIYSRKTINTYLRIKNNYSGLVKWNGRYFKKNNLNVSWLWGIITVEMRKTRFITSCFSVKYLFSWKETKIQKNSREIIFCTNSKIKFLIKQRCLKWPELSYWLKDLQINIIV